MTPLTPYPAPLRDWLASRPHSMQSYAESRPVFPRIMIADIQAVVSRHFRIDEIEMTSERRSIAVARPRQIAMYLAKRLTARSLPEIGQKFGNRDHSTVIHAVRRIEGLRDTDPDIDTAVRALLRKLKRRNAQ